MDIQTFIMNFTNAIDGIASGSITGETDFKSLPQWDSLALLSLLAMVDCEYGVEISGNEIQSCTTVEELAGKVFAKK